MLTINKYTEIVDLTQTLQKGVTVYPGEPEATIEVVATVETDGYKTTHLDIRSHTGTHIDCPAHFYSNGSTTDNTPLSTFIGNGIALDCRSFAGSELIPWSFIAQHLSQPEHIDFILLFTGQSKTWCTPQYLDPFPTQTPEATRFLIDYGIKGIGIDAISIDAIDTNDYASHHLLLSNGKIIIENLCNLDQLFNRKFTFCCFPLKINQGDGSPVRAVALCNDL